MRERKYIKFRVDMYDDTKFKIIDTKPERDLLHYIWSRVVILAGKVNLEGELYLSKTIPYSLETLAIEFNRDINQVKLAFNILMELEMLEFIEGKIYKVKNFAKHQNIKVKEKDKIINQESSSKSNETQIKEDFKGETKDISRNIVDEESEGKILNELIITNNHEAVEKKDEITEDLKVTNMEICKTEDNLSFNKDKNRSENSKPMILEVNRINCVKKKKKKDSSSDIVELFEEKDDNFISNFSEGEYKLNPGECVLTSFAFD
ncbi:phage replisome organizer N-terminal domain-containing protein [Clostridium chromiireducens]|uniref:phage replisome organizer N-terminal domain-containing protein n=1 Tax=Clostridium chromiireducens TaxID=225345 RepID=UPI003AF702C7